MSTGGIIGSIIGGLAGFLLGGYYGMIIGATLGLALGQWIDPIRPDMQTPGSPDTAPITFNACKEGHPLPEFLGTTILSGNLLDIAGERSVEITEEYEVPSGKGGGSSTESYTTGWDYYAYWILGLGLGQVDELYTIYKDGETPIWYGNLKRVNADSDGKSTILIDDFGIVDIYWGTSTQQPSSEFYNVSDAQNRKQIPYRPQMITVCKDCKTGANMNRVPSLSFVCKRVPDVTGMNNSNKEIGDWNYNPAHAIWYVLTNMSNFPTSLLNATSFESVASELYSENRGISCLFATPSSTANIVDAILKHIRGYMLFGSDGKFHLHLLRASIAVGDIPTISRDDLLSEPQIECGNWNSTINEQKVQYAKMPYSVPAPVMGVFAGGWTGGAPTNSISYVNIYNTGNSQDFGDLTQDGQGSSACSNGSNDKGVIHMGAGSLGIPGTDDLSYITISTPSNAIDWGDLTYHVGTSPGYPVYSQFTFRDASASNSINGYGVFYGGDPWNIPAPTIFSDVSTKINIVSGSLSQWWGEIAWPRSGLFATSNGVGDRAIFGGGWGWDGHSGRYYSSWFNISHIDTGFITAGGFGTFWGDLDIGRAALSATSNKEYDRAVIFGGTIPLGASYQNTIDYYTISQPLSNSVDFGDLSSAKLGCGVTSSGLRGRALCAGGSGAGGTVNNIDYVTITVPSNAADFGDLISNNYWFAGLSNS